MRSKQHLLLRPTLSGLVSALAALALSGYVAKATPFASCITNNGSGTITFYLNEGGGAVTITYDNDTSTNASFNGTVVAAAGPQTFSLAGHSTYKIYVRKVGSGTPSITTTIARGTARGIAANGRGASPYFGYVYSVIGGSGTVMQHSDGSGTLNGAGLKPPIATGDSWGAGGSSEYFISIAPDDSVLVSDFQAAGGTWPYSSGVEGGVVQVDPTFTTAQLLLSGLYNLSSPSAPGENHGVAESRAVLSDVLANSPTLYVIDGSAVSPWNQIAVYSNLNSASLPWSTLPDFLTPPTGPAGAQGSGGASVLRAGLALGTNGYLYVSQDRANLSNPNFQVWNAKALNSANASALTTAISTTDATRWPSTPVIATNLLWSSYWFSTNGATIKTNDYTVTGTPALPQPNTNIGPSELALSPDNRYIALIHDDNHVTIFTLTNGIPDLASEYLVKGLVGTSTFGRGICWDAAGNLWLASSGLGSVYQVSLGRTATTITSGNASGPTGFQVVSPTEVDVIQLNPSVPFASQANSYGNSATVTNVITRTGNVSSPLRVFFTFGGTAAAGTYTTSATGSILFAPGQVSSNIVITAVTDTTPRPTTTVVLTPTADPSGQYIVGFQNAATDYIVNTATPQLVAGVAAGTMYKAFSNDFSSMTLTRWGDTNTAFTTAGLTYGGTAVRNTDYATLSSTVTFSKGDLTKTLNIATPLINGHAPVYSTSIAYTGDKTITVTPTAGTGYVSYSSNNTATLTILDSAYPPAAVLWSDPLTNVLGGVDGNDDGTGLWTTTALVGDSALPPDYNADFGYDLTANNPNVGVNGQIPLPPSGAITALRVTANKIHGGEAAMVNLYPTNMSFSGDYALRFNMYIVQGSVIGSSAEGPMFGINHTGTMSNWWYWNGTLSGGPWGADGVWYWVNAWAGTYGTSPGDYQEFTGITNTIPNVGWVRPATTTFDQFLNVYKTVLYTSVNTSTNVVGGLPANASPFVLSSPVGYWADVEVKTVKNVVTMSINHTPVLSYVNTNSLFQSGFPMLGYEVPNAEDAGSDAAAYFSNLQVVRLSQSSVMTIKSTTVSGGNVMIQFSTSNGGDTTSSFALQSSATVNGTYTDVSPAASFTQITGGFQTIYPENGPVRFYRIRHL